MAWVSAEEGTGAIPKNLEGQQTAPPRTFHVPKCDETHNTAEGARADPPGGPAKRLSLDERQREQSQPRPASSRARGQYLHFGGVEAVLKAVDAAFSIVGGLNGRFITEQNVDGAHCLTRTG